MEDISQQRPLVTLTLIGIIEPADMLEETDWFVMDFQNAFRELENEGRVENLDRLRKRPVHAVNFEKEEKLVSIK